MDKIPLNESFISLALYRNKRDINSKRRPRFKRDFIYYNPINITEKISQKLLDNIIANLELNNRNYGKNLFKEKKHILQCILRAAALIRNLYFRYSN